MQQVTINLPSGHPVRAMQGLAKSIALPAEHAPQRFPSFPALERTAVMAFTQPTSLELPASTAVKLGVTRQASYPVWGDRLSQGTVVGAGYRSHALTTITDETATFMLDGTPYHWNVGNQTGLLAGTGSRPNIAGGLPNYPTGYATFGMDAGTGPRPWLYVPNNWSYTAVCINNTGNFGVATTINITVEEWNSPGETSLETELVSVAAAGNGGAAAPLQTNTVGKWIRPVALQLTFAAPVTLGGNSFSVYFVAASGAPNYAPAPGVGTINVVGAPVTAFVPLLTSSEFSNSQLPWYATRTTAAGLLGTNVTQVLNKAGTVLAGRVSPNVVSMWTVTSNYISGLHPAEKAWLPLETGVYTFCPPSTDMANFWDYTLNTASGSAACPVYRLDNDSLVNVMYVTAGAAEEALALTVSWHIEFRTSSALFQVALSGMSLEVFHQAQLSLAAAGFFFDNPDHKAILSKIISAVNRVAPAAFGALSAVHPNAAMALKAGYNAAASLANMARNIPVKNGPMRMVPTTGQRSGIVGRKPQAKRAKATKGKR